MIKKINNKIKILAIIITTLNLIGCHKTNPTSTETYQLITVNTRPLITHLYYAGTIQPLKTVVITSPVEGIVEDMLFHYGDIVKNQQPLFTLSSTKFQIDYKSAIMEYIKAKTEFNNSANKLNASQFLYKNELISKDSLKTDETNYFNAQLSLAQAKEALENLLKQLDTKHSKNIHFEALNISDIDKINTLLHQQASSQKIAITAPTAGVVLLGDKEDGGIKINKGAAIKQGDLLAMIGDFSGLSLHININEFNINQLKIGQKVKITGTAFPEYTLEGRIAGIDHQAQSSQGNVPVFAIEIIVPKLTPAQQSIIHVGMSAKVTIDIQGNEVISVPLNAVYMKNTMPYMKIQDKKTDKLIEIPVKTGQTTEDSVVILSPLKTGDRIAIPH